MDVVAHESANRSDGRTASRLDSRRAYALVLAFGFVAIGVLFAMSFAARNSLSAPSASNRAAGARAQCLAASGIRIAAHNLIYPPSSVSSCGYWTGTAAAGISIDGTSDTCSISVSKSSTDSRLYTITSVGTAYDRSGVARAARTIKADILAPPLGRTCIRFGYLGANGGLPKYFSVAGDLHANNTIASQAWCNGTVSSTGLIVWGIGSAYGPPAALLTLQPAQTMPNMTSAPYLNYTTDGLNWYAATTYLNSALSSGDPVTGGGAITSANPAGVVYCAGDLKINSNVNFVGTLLCDHDFRLTGNNVTMTATPGFPAVVVAHDFRVENDGTSMSINGAVLVSHDFDTKGKLTSISITGALVALGTIQSIVNGSSVSIVWDASRSWLYDLSATSDTQPYTILRWIEG